MKAIIERVTVESVQWEAVQTVLQVGEQYQFKDADQSTTIILDPSFPGEEAALKHLRALIETWDKETIEPEVIRYRRTGRKE